MCAYQPVSQNQFQRYKLIGKSFSIIFKGYPVYAVRRSTFFHYVPSQRLSSQFLDDFKINENTGLVMTSKKLERQKTFRYNLTVKASDFGMPVLTSQVSHTFFIVFFSCENMTFYEI